MSRERTLLPPAIETSGALETIAIEEGALQLRGWVAPPPGVLIDDFRVACGGDVRHGVTVLGAGEPARRRPPHRAAAPFALRVPLAPGESTRVADRLWSVIPVAGDRAGCRLVGVPRPAVPLPDDADLASIFGGTDTARTRAIVHAAWPVGFEYLGYLVDRAALAPGERVLEVGCGLGRMAYALSYYLDASGRYEGFDPMPNPVRWARSAIASRHSNFAFRTVDVRNPQYHPSGLLDASSLTFPYEDASFDLVLLVSVFTHMVAPAVRHYLSEVHRVLRPGGRCLCSWYLLNDESSRLLAAGRSNEAFDCEAEDGLAQSAATAESLIAFRESSVRNWLEASGFVVPRRFPGRWCGRDDYLSYQDILIAGRP